LREITVIILSSSLFINIDASRHFITRYTISIVYKRCSYSRRALQSVIHTIKGISSATNLWSIRLRNLHLIKPMWYPRHVNKKIAGNLRFTCRHTNSPLLSYLLRRDQFAKLRTEEIGANHTRLRFETCNSHLVASLYREFILNYREHRTCIVWLYVRI